MIRDGRALGLIPARGGSKGLPGKNLLPLGGKPLLHWTVAAGKGSKHIDRLVLSSDDEGIASAARDAGCDVPFMRPPALAADDTPTIEVALHALDMLPGHDWLVLLQPTSPLREAHHIDECIGVMLARGAPSAISVCASETPPEWMFRLDETAHLSPLLSTPAPTRRQDAVPTYVPNGAVYVIRVDILRAERRFILPATVASIMPADASIDIDTRRDLQLAELVLSDSNATG